MTIGSVKSTSPDWVGGRERQRSGGCQSVITIIIRYSYFSQCLTICILVFRDIHWSMNLKKYHNNVIISFLQSTVRSPKMFSLQLRQSKCSRMRDRLCAPFTELIDSGHAPVFLKGCGSDKKHVTHEGNYSKCAVFFLNRHCGYFPSCQGTCHLAGTEPLRGALEIILSSVRFASHDW